MIIINGTINITQEEFDEMLDLLGATYTHATAEDTTKIRNAFVALAGEDYVKNLGL